MKKKIPDNYTEKEVVDIIQRISRRLSSKFTLGYYATEDIEQEAFILGWDGLDKYNGEYPLAHFLYVHMHYRFLNLIRNKVKRADPPCYTCHAAHLEPILYQPGHPDGQFCKTYTKWIERNSLKSALMNGVPIGEMDFAQQDKESRVCPEFSDYVISLLKKHLPDIYQKNFSRMLAGANLKNKVLLPLLEECRAIVKKFDLKWEEINEGKITSCS